MADEDQPADDRDTAFIDGWRRAWLEMLQQCLAALGYASPESVQSAWVAEREEVVSSLRQICEKHGDNDWGPDMHLSAVIEKHLEKHLS